MSNCIPIFVCQVTAPIGLDSLKLLGPEDGKLFVGPQDIFINGHRLNPAQILEIRRVNGQIQMATQDAEIRFTVESPLAHYPDSTMASIAIEVIRSVKEANFERACFVSSRLGLIRKLYYLAAMLIVIALGAQAIVSFFLPHLLVFFGCVTVICSLVLVSVLGLCAKRASRSLVRSTAEFREGLSPQP